MTYKTIPTVFVTCDSGDHPGDPIFKVEFNPNTTPNAALADSGWRFSARMGKQFCPDCAKILRMRN